MLIFAQHKYLVLLLLVPLIPLLYAIARRRREATIAKLGDKALVSALMPDWSSSKGWVRVILFSLAFGCFVIGLSRPQIGAKLKEHQTKGAEVMIVLDVSNSMLAQDYSPNRLERAKLAISRIVDKLKEDRIGLVLFAGTSFVQLPITTDYVSAKMFLSSISTESVPLQGTAMGEALSTAIRSFSAQSEKSRAIILITDGENHEDDPVAVAEEAAKMGIVVYTIGVGSAQGQPIPTKDGLLRDSQGEIVVTKLDENTLQRIAEAGGGKYIHAGNEEFGLNPIIESIRKMDDEIFQSVVFEEYDEQYMYFFALALLLFVVEMLIGSKKSGRSLFRPAGGVMAAALCLLPSSLSAQPAKAPLDRKEIRAGNRKFAAESFSEADLLYRKAILKDSLSFPAWYNLASAQIRQEDFQGAVESLAKLSDAAAGSVYAADYYYNKGYSAIMTKNWKAAVEALEQSLLRCPDDIDAKENYIYAKKMLENQQGGGGGDSQDNDQNQDQNQDQDGEGQDQNQDQNPDQSQGNIDSSPSQRQGKISPQQAQQMLQAIAAREKETQDKVNKEKAKAVKSARSDRNW